MSTLPLFATALGRRMPCIVFGVSSDAKTVGIDLTKEWTI